MITRDELADILAESLGDRVPAEVVAALAAGTTVAADYAPLAEYIDAMVISAEALAAELEPAMYAELAGKINAQADPIAIAKAQAMAQDAAREQAETLATNMTKSQLRGIADEVARGLDEGLGPREIARRLDDVKGLDSVRAAQYRKYAEALELSDRTDEQIERMLEAKYQKLLKDRRDTIASTEANHAVSEAQLIDAKASGKKYKVWITTGDGRVSDACQGNESQGPIALDKDFSGGVQRPPQHPNCRCNVSYIETDAQRDRAEGRAKDRAKQTEEAKAS